MNVSSVKDSSQRSLLIFSRQPFGNQVAVCSQCIVGNIHRKDKNCCLEVFFFFRRRSVLHSYEDVYGIILMRCCGCVCVFSSMFVTVLMDILLLRAV